MSIITTALGGPWPLRVLVIVALIMAIGGPCIAAVTLPLAARIRRRQQALGSEGDPTRWRNLLSSGILGGALFLAGAAVLLAVVVFLYSIGDGV